MSTPSWISESLERLVNDAPNGIKVPLKTAVSETVTRAVQLGQIAPVEIRQGESGPEFWLVKRGAE
jgi:hypothetical protein